MSFHRLLALLLALAPITAPLAQEGLDLEADPNAQSPLAQPEGAWQQAMAHLPPGHRVRRLAFAHHILFVFHSLPYDERILATGDALSDYDVGWVNLALDGPAAAAVALASLQRLADLAPRVLLPAHGPIPADSSAGITSNPPPPAIASMKPETTATPVRTG